MDRWRGKNSKEMLRGWRESNNREEECASELELCQPVQRAQRLKNICDTPLLLYCMFQGMLLDIVILQKALMGLQRYQAHPSERGTATVLLLLGLLKARCLSLQFLVKI